MQRKNQKGQALLLVVLAAGLFLIGAMGLVVDGAQIYAHRQMAQVAADAGAQAGIMSIYDGTNGSGGAAFGTGAAFTCTTNDARTPCVYARKNGFGGTASDTVVVDFPTAAQVGVDPTKLSGGDPVNILRVTVNRTMTTGLIHLLGAATAPVKAIGAAAIVELIAPVPILVLHPNDSGSFNLNGNVSIKICGGPSRSIQVNSCANGPCSGGSPSLVVKGGGSSNVVDLSHAGPKDSGICDTGTGADFGDYGGPSSYPSTLQLGTTGHYIQPASPLADPLLGVTQPSSTGLSAGTKSIVTSGTNGCPIASCTLYTPGIYGSIDVKNDFALFEPGLYYVNCSSGCSGQSTGFAMESNSGAKIATGFTGTGDFANNGLMVFLTGGAALNIMANAGTNGGITLVGSDPGGTYKSILFFADRAMAAASHTLGGGGSMSLTGTVYLTNTAATMLADATQPSTHFQALSLQGGSGSSTLISGEIIVDELSLGGGGGATNITMNLNPLSVVKLRQVALVH
jgi:hypothetical protein